ERSLARLEVGQPLEHLIADVASNGFTDQRWQQSGRLTSRSDDDGITVDARRFFPARQQHQRQEAEQARRRAAQPHFASVRYLALMTLRWWGSWPRMMKARARTEIGFPLAVPVSASVSASMLRNSVIVLARTAANSAPTSAKVRLSNPATSA